ncbi:transporter substrate-binding domain-containing protein [Pseudodesulfovibrio sp. zrk46]|uniref:substrate-binding periplasmic protein n=1 Tax=Pseudodesulfovibrio sp. zrk46 TaxID=2725288 RepID=UPI0014492908|nr:transporter substrate-binding domain-containing protein [Pseudodesulfovibrio sp. zrk46]QJB56042.1 amino acid ABC transporter substrate-binding protein [Pseudodesulfovibrio sp. zrk46]
MKKWFGTYGFIVIALLVAALSIPMEGYAVDIKEVVSTSPAWQTFTNRDGSGLYHEVLREVFGLYGIPVRHVYAKSGRSEELLLENEADMMTCDDSAQPPLVLGRYPMYENDYFVFFKKERIGQWSGNDSLRDKEILSQPTYYSETNFEVPVTIKDVQTGEQAVAMIVEGRSDFYVDDMILINQSLKNYALPYSVSEYDIQKVGRRSYYPLFNSTDKGMAIKVLYDRGIMELHKAGKLAPIYQKWGHQYPDFESY